MVASFTDNLRITKQGDNDNPNTWGQVVNGQVIELFEQAISGVTEVDVTGSSTITLTTLNGAEDQARSAILEIVGVISTDIELEVPSVNKVYQITANQTGGTVTVLVSGGSGVTFTNGQTATVYSNGTDVIKVADVSEEFVLDGTAITDQDAADIADADEILFSDASDSGNLKRETIADLRGVLFGSVYPIGSIYFSVNSTNPGTSLGFGTWVQRSQGRFIAGVGTGTDANGDTREYTQGNDTVGEYEHTLTTDEIPAHTHSYTRGSTSLSGTSGYRAAGSSDAFPVNSTRTTESEGGDEAHENSPPAFGLYVWERTA